MQNQLCADTTIVHVKYVLGVYLEYYWKIDYLKS